MIHNLKTTVNAATHKVDTITFEVITEIGKCTCSVWPEDCDKDKRPKLFADNYLILGMKFDGNTDNLALTEGARRLGNTLKDLCDNNGWNLWSY